MYIQKKIHDVDVVAYKMPYVHSVYVGIWVKSGSVYESENYNGISHFIEHMIFKGSNNRSAKQIAEEIDNIGGQINGFTGKESTCFYIKVLNTHVEKGIDILFDMVFNPEFNVNEIEKEKKVIVEEILMELDSPEDIAYNVLAKTIWKGSTLSLPVLGTTTSVNNLNRDKIIEFYNGHYNKENVVISITGNFNDEVFDIVERYVLKIKHGKAEIQTKSPAWYTDISIFNKDTEQINMCLGMPSISYSFENIYALSIISNAIGGGMSSRLFQKIREEKGLVYSIYSYPATYANTGVFTIFASMSIDNFEEVYNLIIDEIRDINKNGLTEGEIEKFKEQLRIGILMDMDSISSRMINLGKSKLLLNKIYTLDEILNNINNITYEMINDLANQILNIEKVSISLVGRVDENKIRWIKNDK